MSRTIVGRASARRGSSAGTVALISCALWAAGCGVGIGQDLLIRGGRVITLAGADLDKGSVLLRNGVVEKVGRTVRAEGVPVLAAEGRVVMPGFVLAHSNEGMDRANEQMPVVPFVSVVDSLDPSQLVFEDALRNGHLNILVLPGPNTVIGGLGVVLHPFGLRVEDMTVVPAAGLKISLIPSSGNRAAHWAQLRAALDEGKRLLENKLAAAALTSADLTGNWKLDLERLQIDRQQENLLRLLKGELPAWVECGTAADVLKALELRQEYGLDVRLICHPATYRAAPLLAEKKMGVILTGPLELVEQDPETGRPVTRRIPKIFHDAGVRFAVTTSPGTSSRALWYQAAHLVRMGIPRADALAAVTTVAADLIGLGARKGSLAPGRDGDVLVLTDDPLSGLAWVDKAIVGGKLVYDRAEDPRLVEVFGAGAR